MIDKNESLWTIDQLSEFLKIPKSSLYTFASQDRIHGIVKILNRLRFNPSIIKERIEKGKPIIDPL